MKKLNSISLNEYGFTYVIHCNLIFCVAFVLACLVLVFSVFWMQRGIEGFFFLLLACVDFF